MILQKACERAFLSYILFISLLLYHVIRHRDFSFMRELFFHDFGDLSDELFGHVRELTVVMDKVVQRSMIRRKPVDIQN